MVAMRENEERSRMLGMNPFTVKLAVAVVQFFAEWYQSCGIQQDNFLAVSLFLL